ncbi:winged helix-turn-helix transcriptional regulator [Intestinimonas timonensis]|uniref:winged helix-turn-helix transcriptional regulator n=1 Tax=Intestinimonas timonensis TaxID=1689270 RepID=UPI0010309EB1|nr:helix-turn-helix domain-containing protein [Intestinimonas timonensis]
MKCEKTQFNCPVEATLSLIGGKYKPLILWHLIDQPLHYMELQRLIPKATPKMLSQQLHDLNNCGIIHREVIPEKPPKTLYSLTAFGRSLIPILDAMCQWGNSYLDGLDVQPPCCHSLMANTYKEQQHE